MSTDALEYIKVDNWIRDNYEWDGHCYTRKRDKQLMMIPMILLDYVAAHDREIAKAAAKKALLEAAKKLRGLYIVARPTPELSNIPQWLADEAESYGGQKG